MRRYCCFAADVSALDMPALAEPVSYFEDLRA